MTLICHENNIFFITYWHAICNKILRIVSYVRWYTENNTSDPSVTFLASEQNISGDCGLLISHNYHYLIKLVIYFEFLSNTLLQIHYYKLERICNAIASQIVINYYKLERICNASASQFVTNYYKLERICTATASQFVINYYKLERICTATAFQFVINYYKLARICNAFAFQLVIKYYISDDTQTTLVTIG